MHNRFRRTGALVGAGAVVFGALAVVAGNQADAQQSAPGRAFGLHSKKGSNRVIYLDFDGHPVTGTGWNTDGKPASVKVAPYDTNGNTTTWSTAEQDVVRDVWARVAEDYAPFD